MKTRSLFQQHKYFATLKVSNSETLSVSLPVGTAAVRADINKLKNPLHCSENLVNGHQLLRECCNARGIIWQWK